MGRIARLVYTGIEVSRESKVPVLFVSNPGYGKTTLVRKWAEKNNYHVETIIGSSFAKEEVQGYQVNNGKNHLDFLEPYWFTRIKNEKSAGRPTILFIDEISTAPSDVQGSLYRLIFDRCIGNGDKLPDDTLIISAANYKSNLPAFFEITAPALNRFCVINLIPKSTEEMFDEFLSPIQEVPEFIKCTFSQADKACLKEIFLDDMKNLIKILAKDAIDFTNQDYNDVYSNPGIGAENGKIMNFLSGRSLSYLYEVVLAIKTLKLGHKNPFITEAIDGLAGLGTNNFKSQAEHDAYLVRLHKTINQIIFDVKPKIVKKEDLTQYSISDLVNQMVEKSSALEMNDENSIVYSLCIAEKLQDFRNNFTTYIEQNRDFVYSEVKSIEILSQVNEMGLIFNNQFGKNILNMTKELLEMLGDNSGKNHQVMVRFKLDNNVIKDLKTSQSGRMFVADQDSGLSVGKRVLQNDRILAVYNGKKWVSLENYFAS